jgi:hypothetical protein
MLANCNGNYIVRVQPYIVGLVDRCSIDDVSVSTRTRWLLTRACTQLTSTLLEHLPAIVTRMGDRSLHKPMLCLAINALRAPSQQLKVGAVFFVHA